MKNYWLSKIDIALRLIGFDDQLIDHFTPAEKDDIIREEYLYLIRNEVLDCAPQTMEEMAELIIERRRA